MEVVGGSIPLATTISNMPVITLPDGSQKKFDHPVTVDEVAASIGTGLRKAALAGRVDGKVVDTKPMPKTLPMILQWDESFDIGSDTLTGVNDADYKPPFALTAKLNKLTLKLDRPQLSPADIARLEAAMKEKAKGD